MCKTNRSINWLYSEVFRLQDKVKILEAERDGIFIVRDGKKPTLMALIEKVESLEKRLIDKE